MKRTSKKNIQPKKGEINEKKTVINPKKRTFLQKNLKYIFLVLLLFYIGTHFYEQISGNKIFENYQAYLLFPAIIIGIFSVYFDRKKLNETVNRFFISEEAESKHNFTNKIKLFFSKKEIIVTLLFILVLGVSVFTLFYKLDNFDIFSDEIQVTKGAAGYFYTGEFRQWDFIKEELVGKPYNRAKPHQRIVAQSYKIFGVNEFAARFPSALSGVFLIAFMFLLGKYFIKDKYAALLSAFSFSLYFEFLFLGRWARMYGILYSLAFLLFYWIFKFINEKNKLSFLKFNNKFFNKYLNFNYLYLFPILVFVYIGINTHTNIVAIFPVFYLFFLFSIFLFPKEKKYLTAFIIASAILILQILFTYKVNFSQFTFFEINNSEIYLKALFGYPFSVNLGIIIIFISVTIFIFSANSDFKKRYLILFLTVLSTFIFFSYIINYAPSYRYVSFLTPFAILLITGSFLLIIKSMYPRIIQYILVGLFISASVLSYSNHFKGLYEENIYSPTRPSVAQQVIVKNIKEGDVIFKHWGPKLYMKGIPKSTKFYKIGSYKGKDIGTLFKMMSEHQSGWLTWDKIYEARLDPDFISYCNLYFKKYAGYGIDKTGVEVYYYDKSMLMPLELLQYQKNMPAANLYLKNSYSFVFDIKINENTKGSVFNFKNDTADIVNCLTKNKKIIIDTNGENSLSANLQADTINHIIWLIGTKKYTLYINGKKSSEEKITSKDDLVKFKINPAFNGYINNIRIYDFLLNKKQIQIINSDKNISEESESDGEKFRTLFLWKRK